MAVFDIKRKRFVINSFAGKLAGERQAEAVKIHFKYLKEEVHSMKNKVLATALSVCLFAGMALPAFAEYSSQSGSDSDIKTAEFAKDSYTVKNGSSVDLSDDLRTFASTKQLVQEPFVEWSVENDDKFAFTIDTNGNVFANEDAGTATVTAKTNEGKVVTKVKVTAAKNPGDVKATGFQFASNSYALLTGADATLLKDDQTVDVVATPKDAVFTESQLSKIETAMKDAVNAGQFSVKGISPKVVKGSNKVSLVYGRTTDNTGASATVSEATYSYKLSGAALVQGDKITIGGISATVSAAPNNTVEKLVDAFITAAASSTKWTVSKVGTDTIMFTAKTGYRYANPGSVSFDKKAGSDLAQSGDCVVTKASVTGNVLASITDDKVDTKNYELTVSFPNANNTSNDARIRRTISLSGKPAAPVTSINAAGSLTIEVGEKASTASLFKQGPSKGNVTFAVSYGRDYVDQNAQYDDFAVMTGQNADDASEIIGVAVGKNKVTATITTADGETRVASIIVNVVEKGTKKPTTPVTKPSLSFSDANTSVGGAGFTLVVKNAPKDAKITFKSLDEKVAKVDVNGKVTAVAAGKTKVEVSIAGVSEKLYCTVTVKAATTSKPGNGTTDVPQTGVELLGNLF